MKKTVLLSFPLLALILLLSGCVTQDDKNTGGSTTIPFSIYAELDVPYTNTNIGHEVVFVRPGDEFTINMRALNLRNEDLQEIISLNADGDVEFLDSSQFETTIKPNDKGTILKSVRLKINSKGYHRIQVEALPAQGSRNITNYMLGSFHACVVDNLDEAPTVCSDFNTNGFIDYVLDNREFYSDLFLVD